MRPRPLLLAAALATLAAPASADAAILFSPGAGGDVVVTVTEDIAIPLTAAPTGNRFMFVLENVYAANQYDTAVPPTTSYSAGIHADIVTAGGDTFAASGYDQWGSVYGTINLIDRNDFYGWIDFPSAPTAAAGDVFYLRAGTVTVPGFTGVALPTLPVTTIQLMEFAPPANQTLSNPVAVAVPEPGLVLPGFAAMAGFALMGRKRRK